MTKIDEKYTQVKTFDPDLFREIVAISTAIANNAIYLRWNELRLASEIEKALMSISSRFVN